MVCVRAKQEEQPSTLKVLDQRNPIEGNAVFLCGGLEFNLHMLLVAIGMPSTRIPCCDGSPAPRQILACDCGLARSAAACISTQAGGASSPSEWILACCSKASWRCLKMGPTRSGRHRTHKCPSRRRGVQATTKGSTVSPPRTCWRPSNIDGGTTVQVCERLDGATLSPLALVVNAH